MQIHKDSAEDCDQQGYTRFLVDSPLKVRANLNFLYFSKKVLPGLKLI